jgi:hypothetical protein
MQIRLLARALLAITKSLIRNVAFSQLRQKASDGYGGAEQQQPNRDETDRRSQRVGSPATEGHPHGRGGHRRRVHHRHDSTQQMLRGHFL